MFIYITASIYCCCKWLTWQVSGSHHTPAWKQAAYLLGWPGMDANGFLTRGGTVAIDPCRPAEWKAATLKLASGIALLFAVPRLIPEEHAYLAGWVGMVGLILILHFGAFHLLSCAWRGMGVNARPLMNRPLGSTSLSEFWGRRWNTAFRDLTHRFLFRPLVSRFGARLGVVAGFLFSGVVHDLAISVPARGGYGGPTAFFALQGAAVMLERSGAGRYLGVDSGWRGRLFAAVVLIGPLGLLFHRSFVMNVIVPLMRSLGAL